MRQWVGPDDSSVESRLRRRSIRRCGGVGLVIDDLDVSIVAAVAPEQPMPTTAVLVARRLGRRRRAAGAFDVNASCLGRTGVQQAAGASVRRMWHRVGVVAA